MWRTCLAEFNATGRAGNLPMQYTALPRDKGPGVLVLAEARWTIGVGAITRVLRVSVCARARVHEKRKDSGENGGETGRDVWD